MCMMEVWLKGDCQVVYSPINLTTAFSQVLPADPMRFAFTLATASGGTLVVGFDGTAQANSVIAIPTSSMWLSITDNDVGDLVRRPVFMKLVAGTLTFGIAAMSYNPNRKADYDEWVRRQFSKQRSL